MAMSSEQPIDTAKVFGHGKVTLPSEVRNMLNVKDGDKVLFSLNEQKKIMMSKILASKESLGKYSIR